MFRSVFRFLPLGIIVIFVCIVNTNAQAQKKTKATRQKPVRVIVVTEDRIAIERDILSGKYNHDDIGALIHVGTIESVPALLQVLDHFKLAPDGKTMICTRGHALTALYRITGKDLGSSYEAWSLWWEANKEQLLQNKK